MEYKDFYERVKELAKKSGSNIKDFISKLDINYDSYNSLKRYGKYPRADECYKIAKALGVSVEYLLTGEVSNDATSADEIQLLNLIRKIPEDRQSALFPLLKSIANTSC